jgi:hypothetical protein
MSLQAEVAEAQMAAAQAEAELAAERESRAEAEARLDALRAELEGMASLPEEVRYPRSRLPTHARAPTHAPLPASLCRALTLRVSPPPTHHPPTLFRAHPRAYLHPQGLYSGQPAAPAAAWSPFANDNTSSANGNGAVSAPTSSDGPTQAKQDAAAARAEAIAMLDALRAEREAEAVRAAAEQLAADELANAPTNTW